MKKIRSKHVAAGVVLLILAAAGLALGCINHLLWIPALGCAVGYIALDRKFLRCPHCGGFTNLDRLLYAKHHEYHCAHCGNRLEIGR